MALLGCVALEEFGRPWGGAASTTRGEMFLAVATLTPGPSPSEEGEG